MKTTAGPWYVSTMNYIQNQHDVICVKGPQDVIVSVNGVKGQYFADEAMANAALIAIAPEMLDALIAIQETSRMVDSIPSASVNTLISDIFAKLANEAGV
jgi:hypothetical protein